MPYSEGSSFRNKDIDRMSELELQILQNELAEFSDLASRRITEIDDMLIDETDPTERTRLEEEKTNWLTAKAENSRKLDAVSKKFR